jgi:hypothetical protein
MSSSSKAIVFIVIVALVGIGSSLAYSPVTSFLSKTFPKKVNVTVPKVSESEMNSISKLLTNTASSTSKTSVSGLAKTDLKDPDLNGLDTTFAQIRQANLDNNLFLFEQYWSEPTRAKYVESNQGKVLKAVKEMTFSNIRKISSLKVLVSVTTKELSGHTESKDMLFVREARGWRLGIVETEQYFK